MINTTYPVAFRLRKETREKLTELHETLNNELNIRVSYSRIIDVIVLNTNSKELKKLINYDV